MAKVHENISDEMTVWIQQQHIFFVATGPLQGNGHINCSPKGGDSFRIIDPLTVAYQDLTGSGVETIAHLRENGRIVIMFCAFEGSPRIVRLHGKGEVISDQHPDYPSLLALFPGNPGTRAVIRVRVKRVSDSCGFSVPLYEYNGNRDLIDQWADKKGVAGLEVYREDRNQASIDGLAAIDKA